MQLILAQKLFRLFLECFLVVFDLRIQVFKAPELVVLPETEQAVVPQLSDLNIDVILIYKRNSKLVSREVHPNQLLPHEHSKTQVAELVYQSLLQQVALQLSNPLQLDNVVVDDSQIERVILVLLVEVKEENHL